MARVGVAAAAVTHRRPAAAAAAAADVGRGGADHLAAGHPAADPPAAAARARGPRLPARRRARSTCRASSGRATEIQQLRDAFARAIDRVEESEREMSDALEGQRRLVREVHHRVKNNLQVVASLLNIHGRSAETGRSARRLCRDQPPRRRACRSSTATISPRWRKIAGSRFGRCCPSLPPSLRGSAPEDARGTGHRSRPRHRLHHPGRRGGGRLPGHRDRRVRDAQLPRGAGRDLAPPDQRADRPADDQQPGAGPGRGRRSRKSAVRADHRRAGQAAALAARPQARPLQRRSAGISAESRRSADRYGSGEKSFPKSRNRFAKKRRCACSDSDLLPPRSRYPLKWARNRQPSPPRWRFRAHSCLGPFHISRS